MATKNLNLGRVPVSRGEFDSTTIYYKDNIVQYKRGSYQVISESPIVGVPPINNEDIVNNGWIIFAGTLSEASLIKSNTQDLSGNNVQENLNSAAEKLKELKLETIYDISAHNNGVVFESLSTLLSSSNLSTLIPTSVRHGGINIRFIQSSVQNTNNKYVQYRYMETVTTDVTFTNIANWQGVDDEPITGSQNLIKSGGVVKEIDKLRNTAVTLTDGCWNSRDKSIGDTYVPNSTPNPIEGGKCAKIAVNAGDVVKMVGVGNAYGYANFVVVNASNIIVDMLVDDTTRGLKTINVETDGFIYYNALTYNASTDGAWMVYTGTLQEIEEIAKTSPVDISRLDGVIDNTLENSGHAADAKVVGDALSNINKEIYGYEQAEYDTITDYWTDKSWNIGNVSVGGTFAPSSTPNDNQGFRAYKVTVTSGEAYKIYGIGNDYAVKLYCIVDSNNIVLDVKTVGGDFRTGLEVTIPDGGALMYVNLQNPNETDRVDKYVGVEAKGLKEKVSTLETNILDYKNKKELIFSSGLIQVQATGAYIDGVLVEKDTYKYATFELHKNSIINIVSNNTYQGVAAFSRLRNDETYEVLARGTEIAGYSTFIDIDGVYCICTLASEQIDVYVRGNAIVDEVKESIQPQYYGYDGEKININNKYLRPIFEKLDMHFFYHQSMSIYGDNAVFFNDYGRNNQGTHSYLFTIVNLTTNQFVTEIPVTDIGSATNLHGNTSSFGKLKKDSNSLFPLLYVSSFDGGDYINVYDIGHTEQRGYYANLVQVIDLTSVNDSIIGKSIDAVVDIDNNTLITHGYLIGVYETTGNKSCFATINMPLLSDGSVVVITDNDIQDNFQTDVLNFTQDKCYYDGKIYINRGDPRYPEWLRLSVVDLTKKRIVTQIDLSRWGGEPEGIDVYKNDKLLTTYGYRTIYEYIFL